MLRLPCRLLLLVALALVLSPAAAVAPAYGAEQATLPCSPAVDRGVLPVWARGGFSEAKPKIAHELGRAGGIVAILFASPPFGLRSPPAKDHNNKILWVSRLSTKSLSPLRIRAQRMVGALAVGKPAGRIVPGGPGPSIIDLPAAGCWRLTLTWSGHADSLDLQYAAHA